MDGMDLEKDVLRRGFLFCFSFVCSLLTRFLA